MGSKLKATNTNLLPGIKRWFIQYLKITPLDHYHNGIPWDLWKTRRFSPSSKRRWTFLKWVVQECWKDQPGSLGTEKKPIVFRSRGVMQRSHPAHCDRVFRVFQVCWSENNIQPWILDKDAAGYPTNCLSEPLHIPSVGFTEWFTGTSGKSTGKTSWREGQWSIRITEQYWICFRWENNDAYDVEMVDYRLVCIPLRTVKD